MCTKQIRTLTHLGDDKIVFLSKPYGQTDIRTDGWTDISNYRVVATKKELAKGKF